MTHWKPVDQVQDLVNKLGGESGISRFLSGELKLIPRDPADLLRPLGEPVVYPAVTRFVAEEQFTKANGIVQMEDNFKQYILPLPEANVPEAAIQVSELTRAARDFRIAAGLGVDGRGEVALAHFFQAIRDRIAGSSWIAAFVVGDGGETWSVSARLFRGGCNVNAYRLGRRHRWNAGIRFLSR